MSTRYWYMEFSVRNIPGAPLLWTQKARGEEVAVTVAVRARPLLPRERAEGAKACLVADTVRKEVLVGSDRLFTLNHVLGPEASQDDVYSSLSIG